MAKLITAETISTLIFLPSYRILCFIENDDIYNQALQHWMELHKKKFPVVECLKVQFKDVSEMYSEFQVKIDPNDVLMIGCGKVFDFISQPSFQSLIRLFSQVIYENRLTHEEKIYKSIPFKCLKYQFLTNRNKHSRGMSKWEPYHDKNRQNLKTETCEKFIDYKTYLKESKNMSKKVLNTKVSCLSAKTNHIIDIYNSTKKYHQFKLIKHNIGEDLNDKNLLVSRPHLAKNLTIINKKNFFQRDLNLNSSRKVDTVVKSFNNSSPLKRSLKSAGTERFESLDESKKIENNQFSKYYYASKYQPVKKKIQINLKK